jgi:hypothetical protein
LYDHSVMVEAELDGERLAGCHISALVSVTLRLGSRITRAPGCSNEVIVQLLDGGGAGLVGVAPYVEHDAAACFRSRFVGIEPACYAESPVHEVRADG